MQIFILIYSHILKSRYIGIYTHISKSLHHHTILASGRQNWSKRNLPVAENHDTIKSTMMTIPVFR